MLESITRMHSNSQMISESILRLFDGLVKMQAEELTKELQALMDENLTEEEKELLLQRILEGKLRLRETRKQYRRTKKQVNDIYKKYWFERIRFAERSDGSPDMTLKMVATPPTDNNAFDDCYRWGGAVDALAA